MRFVILIIVILGIINLSESADLEGALPMADFLDAIPGDEEQVVLGNDEAVDRWEALPLPVSEADLARDSDTILRDDEAGSNSLARQEIQQEQQEQQEEDEEMAKDFENLQAELSKQQVLEEDDIKNTEKRENVGGMLEIYNVDDFDEKYDDENTKDDEKNKETL